MDEVIKVAHADLQRRDSGSPYKSICPVCSEGVLYVKRSPIYPYHLLSTDQCTNCGQVFIYTDIPDNEWITLPLPNEKT